MNPETLKKLSKEITEEVKGVVTISKGKKKGDGETIIITVKGKKAEIYIHKSFNLKDKDDFNGLKKIIINQIEVEFYGQE